MKRPARLQSAATWLKKYKGKNILRGYCKHFAVDWRCAAIELQQLGIKLDKTYLKQRAETERQFILARQRRKEESKAAAEEFEDWPPYESAFEAYLAGDFEAVHHFELREMEAP